MISILEDSTLSFSLFQRPASPVGETFIPTEYFRYLTYLTLCLSVAGKAPYDTLLYGARCQWHWLHANIPCQRRLDQSRLQLGRMKMRIPRG